MTELNLIKCVLPCVAARAGTLATLGILPILVILGILAAQNQAAGIDGDLLTGFGIFANQKSPEQLKVLDIGGVQ